MISEDEALVWAVREGISRAGGASDDSELFTKVRDRVQKRLSEIPEQAPEVPYAPESRRETPTYPAIRIPVDRKAVMIALSLLTDDA